MTCHWLCADKVIIPCEVSPPSANTSDDYDVEDAFNEDEDNSVDAAESDLTKTLEEEEGCRTPTPAKSLSQVSNHLCKCNQAILNFVHVIGTCVAYIRGGL